MIIIMYVTFSKISEYIIKIHTLRNTYTHAYVLGCVIAVKNASKTTYSKSVNTCTLTTGRQCLLTENKTTHIISL